MNHDIPPDFIFLPLLLCIALTLILVTFYDYRNPWVRAVVFISLTFLGLRYESWRLFDTLNLDDPLTGIISLMIFAAEMMLFVHFLLSAFLEINLKERDHEANERELAVLSGTYLPSVDVFITTYNEALEIIEKTIIGCQAMDYPKKTVYLLDDGHRSEMETLCRQYGCQYISRQTNEHYKAGNLNHAHLQTRGELIACFDADFIPTRNFLKRTVGFFQDAKVALVQTPQNFYNSDPIENNLGLFGVITNEQELFFKKVQPSRDAANAVICCGTSYVIRREALDAVGGYPTVSITEDYLVSIELHAAGYEVVYLNEMLSAGDAPGSIGDYITQRCRWCRGILQALFSSSNPLFRKGLSLKQKLYHSLSMFYWATSIPRVILLLTPLFFLVLGIFPIRATIDGILFYFLPYYVSYLLLENWMSGGKRSPIWSDLYECLICFPILMTTVSSLLKPFGIPFKVTPKLQGVDKVSFNTQVAYPLLVIMLFYGLGLMLALKGWSWQADHEPSIINLAWAVYNVIVLWLAIQICFDVPQQREEIIFACQQPAHLEVQAGSCPVTIEEISDKGVLLKLPLAQATALIQKGAIIGLNIPSLDLSKVPLQSLKYDLPAVNNQAYAYASFGNLPIPQNRRLIELLFCNKNSWPDRTFRENSYLWNFVRSVFRLYPLTVRKI